MAVKKVLSSTLAVILACTVLAGCSGNKKEGDATEKRNVIIGLATDEGGINDKSFNQSANEGAKKATEELGLRYITIEAQKKEDYGPNIQALIDEGCQLAIGVGFQLADDLKNVADQNLDKNFCLIDSIADGENILSITFKEEEGSFLMGVIAGRMTQTNKVGFIGGKDTDTIRKFESGFAAGVKAVNSAAAQGLISTGKSAGYNVKYTESFADTNKGYEAAKSLYESGCDVIYHAAGGSGIGLLQAAKELRDGGAEVWAIGVDMDQAVSLPEYSEVILSSMMKRVDNATYKVVTEEADGVFQPGILVLGIADDGVGLAETTSVNTPQDVIDEAESFADRIKKNEFIVPATREDVASFTIQ